MNYWLKHFNSNVSKSPENLLKQVGKTVNGVEVEQSQINLIVDTICSELNLNEQSRVVDLCCGNGLLTVEVARHCNSVIGVDYSINLINVASHVNSGDNITYINS
ncbi:class I SAM-dependent methyltransferase, partial [Vibrio sp. 10N.261.52.A1]